MPQKGGRGKIAINPLAEIPASPPLGVRSADRPLPAPFRTGLPGWYSRPFPFGGCPLPLHAPRVPPSRVFGFHAESEFRRARPKKRVFTPAHAPARSRFPRPTSPGKAESLAQAQSLLAPPPPSEEEGLTLSNPEVLILWCRSKETVRGLGVEVAAAHWLQYAANVVSALEGLDGDTLCPASGS